MVEESLLTPEVRALVGTATEPARVLVTPRAVQRALETYYGPGPHRRYQAGEDAPGVVIAAFGAESEGVQWPNLMRDSVLISNEWQFERPLQVGEELTAQSRLADITERFGGRFGYSLYIRTEGEFRDATGAVVARSVQTMMEYDARNARDGEGEE